MKTDFTVLRVAMHLVDRSLDAPRYAQSEVDLDGFTDLDRQALDKFFNGHLARAWKAEEGERTRAAVLEKGSEVGKHFQQLKRDPKTFFERSKSMADLLHAEARKKNTTRGLLVVLWFRRPPDRRAFLGLFKMDPGPSELVTLQSDKSGQYLLQLAVEHVEQVLPDPTAGVLKWAVLPHPTRPSFDAKLKDDEGEADLALYFQAFLGCRARLSPKEQARALFDALPEYAAAQHPKENWSAAVSDTIDALKGRERVDLTAVEESLADSGLQGIAPERLRERLEQRDAVDLDFPARSLVTTKFQYALDNGIVVRGPLSAMNDVVISGQPGAYEMVIRTTGYREEKS